VVNLAAYVAGVQAVNIASTREIAPILPFAAALAGRQLGGWLLGGRRAGEPDRRAAGRHRPTAGRDRALAGLRYGLCVVLACYAAMLGYDVRRARPPRRAAWG
jgi:hypothetical protein